ncbi:MAG TPA: hypothetical protein VD993_13655 [Chitinophagaceae bacterium]|nr:hypothetical protein [Chitinophagaceae bacterium]
MPPVATKKCKSTDNIIVVKKMRDYSKEPAFVKKAEEATTLIKKHGLPKGRKKKSK